MTPFCDWLSATVPYDDCAVVLDDLESLMLGSAGAEWEPSASRFGTYRVPFGTCKTMRRGAVAVLSASGQMLSHLRAAGLFSEYLRLLGHSPHTVTRLDATLDVPVPAPAVVDGVYQRAIAGEISLTRKAIKPKYVRRFWGPGADGVETGTVYLGKRANADVCAKVYDKRQERLEKGLPDPGPMVRFEVSVHSGVGASLRDAQDPTALFYHFASPALVDAPPGVPAWSSGALGMSLPARVSRTPAERLQALVSTHPVFQQAAALALSFSGGDQLLRHAVGRLLRQPSGAADVQQTV